MNCLCATDLSILLHNVWHTIFLATNVIKLKSGMWKEPPCMGESPASDLKWKFKSSNNRQTQRRADSKACHIIFIDTACPIYCALTSAALTRLRVFTVFQTPGMSLQSEMKCNFYLPQVERKTSELTNNNVVLKWHVSFHRPGLPVLTLTFVNRLWLPVSKHADVWCHIANRMDTDGRAE